MGVNCACRPHVGKLLLRIGLSSVLIAHGWQKVQDIEPFIGMVNSLGLPSFLAYVVMAVEFIGGILLLVGLLTQWVAWLVVIEFTVIVLYVKRGMEFIGGSELDYLVLFAAAALALIGAGKYAFDAHMKSAEEGKTKDSDDR